MATDSALLLPRALLVFVKKGLKDNFPKNRICPGLDIKCNDGFKIFSSSKHSVNVSSSHILTSCRSSHSPYKMDFMAFVYLNACLQAVSLKTKGNLYRQPLERHRTKKEFFSHIQYWCLLEGQIYVGNWAHSYFAGQYRHRRVCGREKKASSKMEWIMSDIRDKNLQKGHKISGSVHHHL